MNLSELMAYWPVGVALVPMLGVAGLAWWLCRRDRDERARLAELEHHMVEIRRIAAKVREQAEQQQQRCAKYETELEQKNGMFRELLEQGLRRNAVLYERQDTLEQRMEELDARFGLSSNPLTPEEPSAPMSPLPAPGEMQEITPEPLDTPPGQPLDPEGARQAFRALRRSDSQDDADTPPPPPVP